MGGVNATVELCGRPLIAYALEALSAALPEVVVLAKPGAELPWLAGENVWLERTRRQHPLVGLIEALALACDRPVLVCALDLPLVTPELIGALVTARPLGSTVVASHIGSVQPLLTSEVRSPTFHTQSYSKTPTVWPKLSRSLRG